MLVSSLVVQCSEVSINRLCHCLVLTSYSYGVSHLLCNVITMNLLTSEISINT